MGSTFQLRKTLSDFLALNEKLSAHFPRIIFPTFPKKIGEETEAGMPLGWYNGRASLAVAVMCKFLRSYLHEIKSNLLVQQSEIILDFLELLCPIKVVERNEVSQLSRLLEMSVDLNKHDRNGFTALHRAVQLDCIAAVKWLSDCSTCHINSKDNDGNSPLILAIQLDKIESVRILINAGAEVKLKNNMRSSALHIAAAGGQLEICQMLLEKGVKVDDINMKGKSPLHYAILYRSVDVVCLLLQYGAATDYRDKFDNTLLHLAAAAELPAVIERLLATTKIPVNAAGRHEATALHFATACGNYEIAAQLLANGADPLAKDVQKKNCFFTAMTFHQPKILSLLCEHSQKKGNLSLDVELFGSTLIHHAADSHVGHQLCQVLAAYGANLNVEDYKGCTPLLLATRRNNIPLVEELLKQVRLVCSFVNETHRKYREQTLPFRISDSGRPCTRLLSRGTRKSPPLSSPTMQILRP